jgi:hypothetical protein
VGVMITKYRNGMTALDLFQIVLFIIIPHYSQHFLQIQEKNGRQDVVDIISRLSPVAWQHINLNGENAFNKDRKEIDLIGLLNGIETLGSVDY